MVTRTPHQVDDFVEILQGRGARVEVVPLVQIKSPPDEARLQWAVDSADTFDWLVFTSVNGVASFARRRKKALGVGPQIAAVGPVTSEAVASLLMRPAQLVPPAFSADELARALIDRAGFGERVLVLQAAAASPALGRRLASAGVAAVCVAAYSTIEKAPADLPARLAHVDVVTLASGSAVRSLVGGLERSAHRATALRGKLIACIGAVTEAEARRHGLAVDVIAQPSTAEGLVDALCRYYAVS
ncbi:MAG: uroporphyrinogen-III synthase [Candidatus Eremiobacteraeota bacterium]|nr:uroporphyrinogen-III synthase [Candidatus Eremiobacteraeota bacterium]